MTPRPLTEVQHKPQWNPPDPRFLQIRVPQAPELPSHDVLEPQMAKWVENAAEAKGAPADYTLIALLAVVGSIIGNARWVSPWRGWEEPPIIWAMCVGLPSSGKSPGIDAVLQPLRKAERALRDAAEARKAAWSERSEIAKLADTSWKEAVKAAMKSDGTPPDRPEVCFIEPEPHVPRLVVNDATIERVGAILARQLRGTLQMRDELAGWLQGMSRYSGGGSDRPFWLEAYGGRGFTVERIGRDPIRQSRSSLTTMACWHGFFLSGRTRHLCVALAHFPTNT